MTIVKCLIKNKTLHPLEPEKIKDFCSAYQDGVHIEMKLAEWESGRSENASRYFHKLRDRYASAMGYTRDHAKAELKYSWGEWLSYDESFEPPKWAGEFIEIYGKIVFMKSTREYTKTQMGALIEGTIQACFNNSISIDDLIQEYGERKVS